MSGSLHPLAYPGLRIGLDSWYIYRTTSVLTSFEADAGRCSGSECFPAVKFVGLAFEFSSACLADEREGIGFDVSQDGLLAATNHGASVAR